MRIRRKLLLLVLFLGAALLVNLMALGYLARTMIAGLQDIEQVALERQLIGVEMQARLRSAEAALYRYVIEGEEGFRRQFEAQLASFEAGVEAYRGQATNASARQWAGALADSHAQAQLLGAEMILLRDQYEDAFVELDQVHTGLTQLLDQPPPSAHTEDPAYRAALDGMQQSLRDM
ncbi:MAG: hypothetical protein H3C34_24725, partial [Caldilineaceae bacterium]|nr:hypothetical protein [Caldilineaceae bacterium]